MEEQTEFEQGILLSESDSTAHHQQSANSSNEIEDLEHKDYIPNGIWQEMGTELHELVDNLVSKLKKSMHLENLLQEKPKDIEGDKTVVLMWLDKLINLVKTNSEETEEDALCYTSRGLENEDVVNKLERFKVKNLAGGSAVVKEDKKK